MELPEALREMLWWLTAWEVRALGLLVAVALAGFLRIRGASAARAALLGANAFVLWLSIPFPLMAAVAYLAGYSPPAYALLGVLLLLAAGAGTAGLICLGQQPVRSSGFVMGAQVALVVLGVAVLMAGYIQFFG